MCSICNGTGWKGENELCPKCYEEEAIEHQVMLEAVEAEFWKSELGRGIF